MLGFPSKVGPCLQLNFTKHQGYNFWFSKKFLKLKIFKGQKGLVSGNGIWKFVFVSNFVLFYHHFIVSSD